MKKQIINAKKDTVWKVSKRIAALTGALLISSAFVLSGGSAIIPQADMVTVKADNKKSDADEIKYGNSIKLVEWTRCSGALPESNFWGMFMWQSGGTWYHSAYGNIYDDDWVGVQNSVDPYIATGNSFLTRTYLGAPYFIYKDKDGDNNKHNRYWIRVGSNKDKENTNKYIYLDGDDIEIHNGSGDKFTIRWRVATGGTEYDVFYNRSGWFDTRFEINDGRIQGDDDDWNTFRVYKARDRIFSAINDYTVPSGQTQKISSDCVLLDGKTLKVADNAVLNIEGNFLYNGKIECEGTIIVQENATMVPFSPTLAAGNIVLKNGGTLIIMPGARVLAGLKKNTLNSTADGIVDVQNGNIINYGLFAATRIKLGSQAVYENHPGGRTFLGYGVVGSSVGQFYNQFNASTNASSLGLYNNNAYIEATSGATFKAFYGSGATFATSTRKGYIYYISYDKNGKMSTKNF